MGSKCKSVCTSLSVLGGLTASSKVTKEILFEIPQILYFRPINAR